MGCGKKYAKHLEFFTKKMCTNPVGVIHLNTYKSLSVCATWLSHGQTSFRIA